MSESSKYKHQFTIEEADVQKGRTSHAKLLQMVSPGSTVLECGPAYGVMTRYMKERLNCKIYIIEVDPDCYATSIQYADGGVCADIEDDSWLSHFNEASFDYILYADVLEHLKDPQLVLTKMKRLLKADGAVLLSVPNVANGDIIINLLCDRFHYTPLGLLDNTHIHLFARKDLHAMIQEAGYNLAYESYTVTPPFCNEQGAFLSQEERLRFEWVLIGHNTRSVYQFICRLVTTKTEMQSDIEIEEKNQICELNKQLEAELESYDLDLKLAIQQREQLKAELESYNLNLKQAIEQREQLKAELESYDMNLKLAIEQREQSREQNEQLQAELESYDLNLKHAIEQREQSREQNEQLQAELERYNLNLKQAIEQREQLKEQNERLQTELESYDLNLKLAINQREQLKIELDEIKRTVWYRLLCKLQRRGK